MKIKKGDVPQNLPLLPRHQPGQEDYIGGGKDNAVFGLGQLATSENGYVVKVNTKLRPAEAARFSEMGVDLQRAKAGVSYKKNKYEILKHFLGDFIPNTSFAVGQEGSDAKKRYVELSFQERVPEYTLQDLSTEQKADPRLEKNISALLKRLQYMYRILGETNARVNQGSQLDAKLDLKGLSDAVREIEFDHKFSSDEVAGLINSNKSPNLLVDISTMHVYCVDFDQGQWSSGMSQSKDLAFAIDRRVRTEFAAEILGPQLVPPFMSQQSA